MVDPAAARQGRTGAVTQVIDIDRLVATYAHQVIARDRVPETYFLKVLETAEARA